MGKVSFDRLKTYVDNHFKHRSMHLRLRPKFVSRLWDYPETTVNRSVSEWPLMLGSMFPSFFDGIRPGRFSKTAPSLKRDKSSHQPTSKIRIIPIQVEGNHRQRNSNSEIFNAVNSMMGDDDVAEVIDCTEDNISSDLRNSTYKYRKRSATAVTKSVDPPIIIDGEDTQESVGHNLSRCGQQKPSEGNVKKPGASQASNAVLINEVIKSESISSESPILIDVDDGQESLTQNPGDKTKLISDSSRGKNSSINDFERLGDDVDDCGSVSDLVDGIFHIQYLGDSPPPDSPVYEKLKKKLKNVQRKIHYITGDGNCFFRALSKVLYGVEGSHSSVRKLIVYVINYYGDQFAQFIDQEDVQEHVRQMSEDACWATTCEIYAAATFLQRDIFILTPNLLNSTYSWLVFKPLFKVDQGQKQLPRHPCCITLCNTNGNHYDLVLAEHGNCNCFIPDPELDGVSDSIDLTK